VVVADMIEHVGNEGAFVAELARVLKPGGRLIVNTPHARDTVLRRLRLRLGQTDEKHGHLRPGYTRESLSALLRPSFDPGESKTYTKAFSEVVDTAMQWALERVGKKSSKKGVVVTGGDLDRHAKLFAAYSAIFPFVWTFSRLDALLPGNDGYRLLLTATRRTS
jgi:SAM-dependent methyltransferase